MRRGATVWLLCIAGATTLAFTTIWVLAAEQIQRSDVPPRGLREAYNAPSQQWPPATVNADVSFTELAALPEIESNPKPEKTQLGRDLFHDPLLSKNRDLACGNCHQKNHGWSDGLSSPARRNTPTLFSVTHRAAFSWDGRHDTLESQLLAPLTDKKEMANPDMESALVRLRQNDDYAHRFQVIYGDDAITDRTLADALAAFVATIDEPTRFDRFANGDRGALDDEEIWGLHLFRTKAGCANCHFGPLLTDDRFHNLGLSAFGEPSQDLGRYEVTGKPDDAGRFRTPSLRHISRTAPYMHSGHFATLEGIIHFYNEGGGKVWARNEKEASQPLYPFAARLSSHLKPLSLAEAEMQALAAFLRAI